MRAAHRVRARVLVLLLAEISVDAQGPGWLVATEAGCRRHPVDVVGASEEARGLGRGLKGSTVAPAKERTS